MALNIAPLQTYDGPSLDPVGSYYKGTLMRTQLDENAKKKANEEAMPGLLQQYKMGDQGALIQIAQSSPELAKTLMAMDQAKQQGQLTGMQMQSTQLDIAQKRREQQLAEHTREIGMLEGFQTARQGIEDPEQIRKIQQLYIKDAETQGIKVADLFKQPWSPEMDKDIDHVLTIGKHMLGQKPEFLKVGKDETILDPKTMRPIFTSTAGAGSGPYDGTAMDAQNANILLKKDPSSPEYLAAYNMMAQPKTVMGPDGAQQTINPDMSAYRKPAKAGAAPEMGDKGGTVVGDPTLTKVNGLEIQDGMRPTPADAKAVKDILEAKKNIGPLMEDRAKILSAEPNPIDGTQRALLLDQNTAQIALKLKSLEQTGALDDGSVKVMMDTIGDPVIRGEFSSPISSVTKSVAKTRGGAELTQSLLDSGIKYLDNTLKSAVESRGYKFKETSKDEKTPDAKAPKGVDQRLWDHMTPEERKLF